MSWLGKILGGGLGALVGGPIGALAGAALGHQLYDARRQNQLSALEQKQTVYFVATFSMLAKLAKADGVVTQHEIDSIDRVMRHNMRLTPEAREFAIRVFNEAKNSTQSFADYARQMAQEFGGSPEILLSMMELLFVVAHADGRIDGPEEALLREAAALFGLAARYDEILGRVTGIRARDDVEASYRILGASPDETLREIKKRYRRLAMEHHPDRVQSQGLSPELAALAEGRFKEIQHAWDVIEKAHGRS